MKEQEKPPEKELNEMKSGALSDTQFKIMVIRMLRELELQLQEKGYKNHKKEPVRNEGYTN